jgi:hypothetical protein
MAEWKRINILHDSPLTIPFLIVFLGPARGAKHAKSGRMQGARRTEVSCVHLFVILARKTIDLMVATRLALYYG